MTTRSVTEQDFLSQRILEVLDRLRLINTDVDRPSAMKDAPDLVWACRTLSEIATRLEGQPCERCGEFFGNGPHGPGFCIER